MQFCRMLLNGGSLEGVQILSPKTVALFGINLLPGNRDMTEMGLAPALFNEAGYAGVGFSLGCGVTMDLAKTRLPGTPGEFFWGGAASTAFWVDPQEDLAVVFMSQVLQSPHHITLRRDLRTLVYSAFTESYAP
jgi:CubicO group peptidase (beta-lactamase class C family)